MSALQLVQYVPWLASRSAGVVAFACVSASVILGLIMSTKAVGARRRARLRVVHEQVALAGLFAIAAHGLLLLADGWLGARPVDLVVPFTLSYQPFSTGLGVLAGWGAALFGLSFYFRRRIGAARWRRVHQASFVVWVLGAVHVIGAGSDAASPAMRALLVGTAAPIGGLLAARLASARAAAPPPPPRVPASPSPAPAPVTLWSRPRP